MAKIDFSNFEIRPKWPDFAFCDSQTATKRPKMGYNGLKWPKMSFVLIFEKKKFSKNFWKFFIIFIPKPYLKRPKMALNGLKSALFWFLKKNFENFFWNFSSFLYQNHTQKCLKWARMTWFLHFDQIHRFWTNLIFHWFDPIWAPTRLKLPKTG